MELETVEIKRLRPHPNNVRQGDIGAVSESLRVHGQYRPIVVQRSTGNILAGNHTWKAAKGLGWKNIDVVWVDVDDNEAVRILLADNRTADLATYDDAALTELLSKLMESDEQLFGTGFDGDDLDQMIDDLTPANPPEKPDLPTCLSCGQMIRKVQ